MATASERIRAARIEALEADAAWGRDHPWAGYCGDDDARAELLADLYRERADDAAADRSAPAPTEADIADAMAEHEADAAAHGWAFH